MGCIHTSQGLEFDYVGVIVGADLKFNPEQLSYHVDWAAYKDMSGKKGLKHNPSQLVTLVKNIYKVLMSRGMKGCYVYFVDPATAQYVQSRLPERATLKNEPRLRLIPNDEIEESQKFVSHLPLYSLAAAAGAFREQSGEIECLGWREIATQLRIGKDYFISKVVGKSMEPLIPDGSDCVFRLDRGGSRDGRVVLVESLDLSDPESQQKYTVKRYHSEKDFFDDGTWKHKRITLSPENKSFEDIVLENVSPERFRVIAEFVACLGEL